MVHFYRKTEPCFILSRKELIRKGQSLIARVGDKGFVAGHSGYLTDAYRRIPRAELAEEYKKVEPRLTIMAPADYGELSAGDRAAIQRQAEMITRLSTEKEALETRLLAIEGDVRAMREFEAEVRRELDAES